MIRRLRVERSVESDRATLVAIVASYPRIAHRDLVDELRERGWRTSQIRHDLRVVLLRGHVLRFEDAGLRWYTVQRRPEPRWSQVAPAAERWAS